MTWPPFWPAIPPGRRSWPASPEGAVRPRARFGGDNLTMLCHLLGTPLPDFGARLYLASGGRGRGPPIAWTACSPSSRYPGCWTWPPGWPWARSPGMTEANKIETK